MRLSLSVLLVTLALCCCEAKENVCPALLTHVRTFILAPKFLYEDLLQQFDAPEPVVQAKLAAKACVDNISYEKRLKALLVVEKVLADCNS